MREFVGRDKNSLSVTKKKEFIDLKGESRGNEKREREGEIEEEKD